MTPMLHMVCGKIGAGKSTLTRRLADAPATVLISEDAWLAALYPGEIVDLPDYVRTSTRLKQVMAEHVVALLAAGVSVVLDFPANTASSRAWARGIFEKAGWRTGSISWMCPTRSARRGFARAMQAASTLSRRPMPSSTSSPATSLRPRRRKAFTWSTPRKPD